MLDQVLEIDFGRKKPETTPASINGDILEPSALHCGPYQSGYVEIHIENPTTHHTWDKGRFTDYLIVLETNNRAFNLPRSAVRHRFSEFIWLRAHLNLQFPDIKAPCLPSKKFFGAQFSEEVIEERKNGLEEFLIKVVAETRYLASSALHLFLQTSLTLEDISKVIHGKSKASVLQTILNQSKRNHNESECSDAGYESNVSLPLESPASPSAEACEEFPDAPHAPAVSDMKHRSISVPELSLAARGRLKIPTHHRFPRTSSGNSGNTLIVPGTARQNSFGRLVDDFIPEEHAHSVGGDSLLVGSYCYDSDQSSSPCTPDGATSSMPIESARRTSRVKKKSVTFSPEVTVAEVVDRFSRRPSQIHLSDVPSDLFAATLAY